MENESKILGKIGVDASGEATVREPIFVSLSSFKKTKYLDIRKYYEKDGQWLPGQKGITLHGDQFSELLNLLQSHKEQIESWLRE
ncbi:MAG: transcriptional coactivator p15/PC4 family protein [Spirochaetales bacterium]|nr:transcriptional coactivator p15/PC4 family protein [Spirochaetales bacterium]